MQALKRLGTAAAATAILLAATAGAASAAPDHRAVFVQNDNLGANQIVAYDRGADGTLTQAGVYATGGRGGQLADSVVDHLGSQGSLVFDREAGLLYAVNAGSNTISVFRVHGDRLRLRQVIDSGGSFPVSVAVHGALVYVLNGKDGGSLQGFLRSGERLTAISGSHRALDLDPTAHPQFVNTPGQVAFSPDGSQLLVTTKANGSSVDVFGVLASGRLSDTPTVNPLPGAVPFALEFDRQGHVALAEAGTNALATFTLRADGTIAPLGSLPTGQQATCWVVRIGDHYYLSNAGSATLSIIGARAGATALTLLGQAGTDAGTVDAAATPNGRYLYVQAGMAGLVDEFAVAHDGTLTSLGAVTVPGAIGGEGIVAP